MDSKVTGSRGSFPDAALHGLLDHLESTIRSLHWEPGGTTWDDYYDHTNYSTAGMETKRRLVAEWLHLAETREVWDLGANDGTFSRLAATGGAHVVSFDVDPSCVERNYRSIRESGGLSVLPLWLDVDNPTPSVGWQHSERRSWLERGPVDTVLALALVHHLAIGNNVPLPRIAELLSRCARRWLIIEFVPKGDSQCARLLASREDVFRDYDENRLLEALGRYFRPERSASIPESQRSLHLLRKVA